MLSSPPYLHTHRPSPTTVLYTVSSTPPRTSLPARALFHLTLLLRLLLGLSVLLLTTAKLVSSTPPSSPAPFPLTLPIEPLLLAVLPLAAHTPWTVLAPLLALTTYLIFRRPYTAESLLVLRGLGIQTSSSAATYLSTATTRFIPSTLIQDVFIHEAFRGFEVRFYLAVIVEGEGEVVVVFPKLLPKRKILEEVWRGARTCLYEPKS